MTGAPTKLLAKSPQGVPLPGSPRAERSGRTRSRRITYIEVRPKPWSASRAVYREETSTTDVAMWEERFAQLERAFPMAAYVVGVVTSHRPLQTAHPDSAQHGH